MFVDGLVVVHLFSSRTTVVGLIVILLPLGSLGVVDATSDAPHSSYEWQVASFDGTLIDITVHVPGAASAAAPAPVVLQSHGWGGSKSGSDFVEWLDDGIGIVTISQRGFGASGGKATVQDPEIEAQDIKAIIDYVASLDWVALDGPNDPVLGGIGASYGGAYQLMTALTEIRESGSTRFNALAPEIAWFDLVESLAPGRVVRSVWVDALYATGFASVENYIHESYAYVVATGQLPDGTVPGTFDLVTEFHEHAPVAFVEDGYALDIPVLIRQGTTDNLFNMNQAWHNFEETLSDAARAQSVFIAYNGGHALPGVAPLGIGDSLAGESDPCSARHGGWGELQRAWYRSHLLGQSADLPAAGYHVATVDGARCLDVDGLAANTPVAPPLALAASASMAGAPVHLPLASGPLTLAGVPELSATITTAGVDARAFLGISVGATPADARVIANNWMPVQRLLPVVGESMQTELAGVALDIPAGQTLFLTVAPFVDQFAHHASRSPGAFVLEDIVVSLPVVE